MPENTNDPVAEVEAAIEQDSTHLNAIGSRAMVFVDLARSLALQLRDAREELAEYRKPPKRYIQCARHLGQPWYLPTITAYSISVQVCPNCEQQSLIDAATLPATNAAPSEEKIYTKTDAEIP
jgi:hypothetical protein